MRAFTLFHTVPLLALVPNGWLVGQNVNLNAAVAVDISNSSGISCQDVANVTRGILEHSYGPHSSLLVISTGDATSANEPRMIGFYDLPFTQTMLEGRTRIKQQRNALPQHVMDDCAKFARTTVSPIVLALRAGLAQLYPFGCGKKSRCILYALTDGEENREPGFRRALNGNQVSSGHTAILDNTGIDVEICGISQTIGGKIEANGKHSVLTRNRTSDHAERLARIWRFAFTRPNRVHIANFCTSSVASELLNVSSAPGSDLHQ